MLEPALRHKISRHLDHFRLSSFYCRSDRLIIFESALRHKILHLIGRNLDHFRS
jgi:hypothetical protein